MVKRPSSAPPTAKRPKISFAREKLVAAEGFEPPAVGL